MTHETCVLEHTRRAVNQAKTGKVKSYKAIKTEECSTIGPIEHKAAMDPILSNDNEHKLEKDNSTPIGEQAATLTDEPEVVMALEQLATVEGGEAVIERGRQHEAAPFSNMFRVNESAGS
ncbi:hypothetical protein NDU88_007770 [Pleurodeles waltl]|uniref:Uncharacterized protein n=1 Tax=Pleurodeles waltl TaxID=8319 RepID=A0AAV7VQN3_PLEWA|nr:hypothetical protein NDU88_007770 [Pleurodeles waltl]